MTAAIVPLPGWQMCDCGAGVASFAVPGGFACETCADELETQRKCESAASIMLSDPGEPSQSLNDLLRKLVQP